MQAKSAAAGVAGTLLAGAVAFGIIATANAENAPTPAPITVTTATPSQEPAMPAQTPEPIPAAPVIEQPVEPAPVAPEPVYVPVPAPDTVQTFIITPPAPPAAGTDPNWIPLPAVEPTIVPPKDLFDADGGVVSMPSNRNK